MKRMRASSMRRGMTLLEAMMAMLVLSIGAVAVFGAVNHVQNANRSLAFQTGALNAFAQIAAQIRDAQCDFPPDAAVPGAPNFAAATVDPGLSSVIGAAWGATLAPVAGSSIEYVGDIPGTVPALRVDYRIAVETELISASTFAPVAGLEPSVPSLNVSVRIREITGDTDKDDVDRENGYWIRIFPVKKVCNVRLDADARGEYL